MPPCFHTLHLLWNLFTCRSIDVQIEEPYWSQWQRLGVVAVCCTNFWDCGDVVSCVTGLAVTLSRCHSLTTTQQQLGNVFSLSPPKSKMWNEKNKTSRWGLKYVFSRQVMLLSILLSKRLKVAFKSKTDKWLCKVTV